MLSPILLALCLTQPDPTPAELSRTASENLVQVQADASHTNSRGFQIVTVRLRIEPTHRIYGHAAPDEVHAPLGLRLTAKTGNPKTRVTILYPRGIEAKIAEISYRALQGEVAIQAIVQRAVGDDSPIIARVDFCAVGQLF